MEQATFRLIWLGPRYWPLWCALLCCWLLAQLPLRWSSSLGAQLGRWLLPHLGRRWRIAETNLRLAFPHLAPAARRQLLRKHAASLAQGLIEAIFVWSAPARAWQLLTVRVEGLEALRAAPNGAIVLTGHFTQLEIGAALLGRRLPGAAMQRPHNHPLIDWWISSARRRNTTQGLLLSDQNPRAALRALRRGLPLWMAADQALAKGTMHSLCSVPARFAEGWIRLQQRSGAALFVFRPYRLGPSHYRLCIEPLEVAAEQTPLNAYAHWLESAIMQAPEDYLWVHRRFKHPPTGAPDPYHEEARFRQWLMRHTS